MKTKNVEFKKMAKGVLLLGLSSVLLTSCGGKKNQTNSDVQGNAPIFQIHSSKMITTNLRHSIHVILAKGVEQNFVLNVSATQGNTIAGQMTPGGASGASTQSYFGINAGFKDIMVITQAGNNQFNVHLSLCAIQGQTTWFIGGNAQLSNFILDFATLNTSVSCSYGNIDQANVRFMNSNFGQDGRSFTKVCWQ